MLTLLKNIPLPLVGVMLGVAALGKLHLLMGFLLLGNIFVGLASCLLLIVLLKVVVTPKNTWEHLQNPIIASVFPTLFLGTLILASIVEWKLLWWVAAIGQLTYVLFFSYRYVLKAKVTVDTIFPSWFVVYVGLGMVPITAGGFSALYATVMWYVAFVSLIVLFPLVCYRVFVKRNIPEAASPLITILAAPISICMLGYLNHFEQINTTVLVAFEIVAQLTYIIILLMLLKLLRLPFYPSYGAFTFPLVASAMSLAGLYTYFDEAAMLKPFVLVEVWIATAVVLYVCIRYTAYMVKIK